MQLFSLLCVEFSDLKLCAIGTEYEKKKKKNVAELE